MAPLSGLVPSNANQLLEALGTCNILLVLYQRSLMTTKGTLRIQVRVSLMR